MRITAAQVSEIARMARLSVPEEELGRLANQFQDLLEYGEIAAKMPLTEPEPVPGGKPQALGRAGSLNRAEVLALAPDSCRGLIRAPRVMNNA